ncbi:hypothetical protein [Nesterenkonia pannonica]|uniref:hypothetical protein n=1 Tax=Nesterenkonia pannonica TaxID=1548602 RepID=UPI002164C696|nr:hypothetical protein [Nesterenkonia pannonica]
MIVRTRGEVSSLEERLVHAAKQLPGEFNLVLARIRPSEPRRSPRRESSRRRQNSGLRLVHETLLGLSTPSTSPFLTLWRRPTALVPM